MSGASERLPSLLGVYVPAPGSSLMRLVAPGSGIVGHRTDGGRVLVYYEGNLYGAENLREFEERLRHAAGRLLWPAGYPTVARALVRPEDLVPIGILDVETSELHFDGNPRAISIGNWWLDAAGSDRAPIRHWRRWETLSIRFDSEVDMKRIRAWVAQVRRDDAPGWPGRWSRREIGLDDGIVLRRGQVQVYAKPHESGLPVAPAIARRQQVQVYARDYESGLPVALQVTRRQLTALIPPGNEREIGQRIVGGVRSDLDPRAKAWLGEQPFEPPEKLDTDAGNVPRPY